MKYLVSVVVFWTFLLSVESCSTNSKADRTIHELYPIQRVDKDSMINISQNELYLLINKGITIAKAKPIADFSTNEHILVVMLLNNYSKYEHEQIPRLNKAYEGLEEQISIVRYARVAGDVLEWIPGPGMGMYFSEIDVHLGGSSRMGWSHFNVIQNHE